LPGPKTSLAIALGTGLAVYLAISVLVTNGADHAQTSRLSSLIGGHFFEHTFTYMLVSLVAGLTYLWATQTSSAKIS
jgi:hypothetical protein